MTSREGLVANTRPRLAIPLDQKGRLCRRLGAAHWDGWGPVIETCRKAKGTLALMNGAPFSPRVPFPRLVYPGLKNGAVAEGGRGSC